MGSCDEPESASYLPSPAGTWSTSGRADQCAKVFLTLALAEAKAFACLRTQPSGPAKPTLADGRLAWNLNEMARLCHIEFVDYFIARLDAHDYHSWREHDQRAA